MIPLLPRPKRIRVHNGTFALPPDVCIHCAKKKGTFPSAALFLESLLGSLSGTTALITTLPTLPTIPPQESKEQQSNKIAPTQKEMAKRGSAPLPTLPTIPPQESKEQQPNKIAPTQKEMAKRGSAPLPTLPTLPTLTLSIDPSFGSQQYRLIITHFGITLTSGSEAGLFHGAQTLRQITENSLPHLHLPCLRIDDEPDYPVRGHYHDVARGRVPTLESLLDLADKLAFYKYNHLQLYIEHTFAFKKHPELWAGCDPLTPDDIHTLDEYCARNHIELVPSLSTFGHLYMLLRTPKHQHLNELEIQASRLPHSFWHRQMHYTLDCQNPDSLHLIRELITELRPHFRSRLFNICCDETFDLGTGRNARLAEKAGKSRLYVDFLKKIMNVVREMGCTPMFWGDIIGNHPKLIRELPKDAIALDWDYSADLSKSHTPAIASTRRPFYVCAGTTSWIRWMPCLHIATPNITSLTRKGLRHGASGFLLTDWGDCGHPNQFVTGLHGIVLGASMSWNTRTYAPEEFDHDFSLIELGDPSGEAASIIRAIGERQNTTWHELNFWVDPGTPPDWKDARTAIPDALLQHDSKKLAASSKEIRKLRSHLARISHHATPRYPRAFEELLCASWGAALQEETALLLNRFASSKRKPPRSAEKLANEWRHFEAELSRLWHLFSRPAEYHRLRTTLTSIADKLDALASRHGRRD